MIFVKQIKKTFIFSSLLFLLIHCEKKAPEEISLKDPTLDIQSIPTIINRSSEESVIVMAKIDDPQGLETIREVSIEITQNSQLIETGQMWDDGTRGDIIGKNGTFTYSFVPKNLTLQSQNELILSFRAKDFDGNFSQDVQDSIFFENNPPHILEVSGPDTVKRSQSQTYVLTARVIDPQGISDIDNVIFNVIKPDGNPSQSNPFSMSDIGDKDVSGDLVAGDGIFSYPLQIGPTTDLGAFTFSIQAQDKSGAQSDVVIHVISVVQ